MVVYWILSIFSVLIHFISFPQKGIYSKKLIASLSLLFLYGAFRVNYGLDYTAYEEFFNGVKLYGLNEDKRIELGYYYLNRILPSFRSVLVIQTILLCTAYYYLFKWYIPEKWAWLGITLLFLNGPLTIFFMLNGIRNGMAISIFILSTKYIYQRRLIPYLILMTIAYFFHNSIILLAPIAYYITNSKIINKKSIIIWLSVMAFVAVSSSTIILDYANVFISTYFHRYSVYVELAKEQGQGAGILVAIFSFIVTLLLLIAVKDKKMLIKENMIIKLTILFFLANLLGPLNLRMSQYLAPFFLIGSIYVFISTTFKINKYFYITVIFLYSIYAMHLWFENPYFFYETYNSILFSLK